MLSRKKFWVPKNHWSKNFGPKQNFGHKQVDQSLVRIRLELAEVFHYTETGTNVAWSNVPKTVTKL